MSAAELKRAETAVQRALVRRDRAAGAETTARYEHETALIELGRALERRDALLATESNR